MASPQIHGVDWNGCPKTSGFEINSLDLPGAIKAMLIDRNFSHRPIINCEWLGITIGILLQGKIGKNAYIDIGKNINFPMGDQAAKNQG